MNESQLKNIYQNLHQIPELALQEEKTQAYLKKVIGQLPGKYLSFMLPPTLPTALLVKVQGSNSQKTICYRADMDGLPVSEQTNLAFSSKNPQTMHACGHDVHLTVALGILSYFSHHQPKDDLIFFFQPAEESYSGAKLAYDQELFPHLDEIYALHVTPDLSVNEIGTRVGTLFAGTTEVDVQFSGQSGHAAYPQQATDMVVASAYFLTQVQTIISRDINPVQSGVVTFGQIEAGSARNIISGNAKLRGTLRGFSQSTLEVLRHRLQIIAIHIAQSFQAQVTVEFNQGGYYPVVNDAILTQKFISYINQNTDVNFKEVDPALTGEDFGYLTHHIPGMMFWLGVGKSAPLHTAKFQPDFRAVSIGVKTMIGFLQQQMEGEK